MKPAYRLAAVLLVAAAMVAGCFGSPAAMEGRSAAEVRSQEGGPFANPALGPYPPAPQAKRLTARWEADASSDWRTLWRASYSGTTTPAGRQSLDLDGAWMVYIVSTTVAGSRFGSEPNTLILERIGGGSEVVARVRAGRIIESAAISYPWVVWTERSGDRVGDWRIVARRMPRARKTTVAKADTRLKERQFAPNIALDAGLLAWDQRVSAAKGQPANRVLAHELRTGRRWCVDGDGRGHMPAVSGRRVFWNREAVRPKADGVGVTSDIYAAAVGAKGRRLTRTGFAMFPAAHESVLAWLNMRRAWLHQPAMADLYYRAGSGPTIRITLSGLAERAEVGDNLIAWQETPGRVCGLDLSAGRAYRLAGWRGREATLLDVDRRRVAYELAPGSPDAENRYDLVIVERARSTTRTR